MDILRGGANTWNAWRESNPRAVPNLAGIALGVSEREMGPAHGGPINLRSALLQNAALRFATLTIADLSAADLSGADLAHARLNKADLSSANLDKSCLDYARLDAANLSGLSLRNASLRFTSLSSADLEDANLAGANLTHARLDRTNLRAANLSESRLDYADFAGADLSEANFRGANLQNARNLTPSQLEGTLGDATTLLPPHLEGCVSWSVATAKPFAIARATSPVRREAAASGHAGLFIWAAALALMVIGAVGWWWHGLSHWTARLDVGGAREMSEIAKRPIKTARTIDRPDIAVRALDPQAATALQRKGFTETDGVAAELFPSAIVRALPGKGNTPLAALSNFQLERLAPSPLSARLLPLMKKAAWPRQQNATLAALSAEPLALNALKPPAIFAAA